MGYEYEETMNRLIKDGKYVTNSLCRFTYGNTWEEVPKANGKGTTTRWSMKLSINDGKENANKFI